MAMSGGYKPSPLGYGSSPRSSPFRRAESPVSPSPLRQSTPTASPQKGPQVNVASRLAGNTSSSPATSTGSWTPRGHLPTEDTQASTSRGQARPPAAPKSSAMAHGNALSQLQPSQVRTLREGFEILDRDSDGTVGREDVADMLNQLGLPSNASDVSQFFPPSAPQTITMGAFLNSLATTLAALSPSSELLSAFSAFDDDDSGQVDVAELRDALLHTAPEPGERALTEMEVNKVMIGFTGRRAFSRSTKPGGITKKGDVFKYQDFVNSVVGGSGSSETASDGSGESG